MTNPLPLLVPPLKLAAEAHDLFDANRREYAKARIADLDDCDCGNFCDAGQTQCAACRDADARDWAGDLQRDAEGDR